jgi:hypothetical protein
LGWMNFRIVGENGRTLEVSEGARFPRSRSSILKLGIIRLWLTSSRRDLSVSGNELIQASSELGMRHLEREHR